MEHQLHYRSNISRNMEIVHFLILFYSSPLTLVHCDPPYLKIYQFGSSDKLGTDGPEPEGGQDYILWENKDLPPDFPAEFSVCFNMKYETLDYWSTGQKTILRIFQEGSETFWLRVNNSPPRGTMIQMAVKAAGLLA